MAKYGITGMGGLFDRTVVGPSATSDTEELEVSSSSHAITDEFYRKITIFSTGTRFPWTDFTGDLRVFKTICSGTLLVEGAISCDGGGGVVHSGLYDGGVGFRTGDPPDVCGTIGGSGSGGSAAIGTGQAGYPHSTYSEVQQAKRWLGGNGGSGGNAGAEGGPASSVYEAFPYGNPSVFEQGVVFDEHVNGGTSILNYVMHPWRICGGGGGGGGGGSATAGGGGAGGGVVWIAADRLVIDGGLISANGQSVVAENYGGGGGGGAVIIMVSELDFISGQIRAQGGQGGSGGANDGSNGNIYIRTADSFLRFTTGSVTAAIYKRAKALYSQKGGVWSGET